MKIAKNSKEALKLIKKAREGEIIILDERQKKQKPRIEYYLLCNNCRKKINCLLPFNCCSKKCAKEYLKKCKAKGEWI
jgi:hypothetical protein